jgi:hypothetical protein
MTSPIRFQEWRDVQKQSQQGIVCDWENNKNVDGVLYQMSGKFDGLHRDLYPSGTALRWSDIASYWATNLPNSDGSSYRVF